MSRLVEIYASGKQLARGALKEETDVAGNWDELSRNFSKVPVLHWEALFVYFLFDQ